MYRRVSAVIVVLTFLSAAGMTAGQSAEDIVSQHLNAKGGLAKLKSINTLRQTSELTRDGVSMTMVISAKRPNLTRQEMTVKGQTIVQVFDGTNAWMINPYTGSSEPMPLAGPEAEMAREQATFDNVLVDYKARGTTVELVGSEEAGEGKRVHHLKVTTKTGKIQEVYIDAATLLESRVVTQTPQGTVDQQFSDFRDVDGVKVAFAIRTVVGMIGKIDIKVLKTELNPTLDDKLFKVK